VQEDEVGIGMTDAPWKTEQHIIVLLLDMGTAIARPQQNGPSAVAFSGSFHDINAQRSI